MHSMGNDGFEIIYGMARKMDEAHESYAIV